MRFIHIADVHLGMQPDAGFPWSEERGEAIWESFRRIIRLAGREKTDFLLIAGDLFQCQPLLRELKEVNDLFASIPETIVVLIAGNHDYVKRESFYRGFDWADNVVMLLSPEPECVEVPEKKTAVYGCSYDKKEILENRLDGVRPEGKMKYHLLLAHGGDARHMPWNPGRMAQAGFDYIACGHIHKPGILIPDKMAYAGALEPTDETQLGPHGYIRGTVDEHGTRIQFVPFARYEYEDLVLNVTEDLTQYALETKLKQELALREDGKIRKIIRLKLVGHRAAELEFSPKRLLDCGRVISVEDETRPAYDLELFLDMAWNINSVSPSTLVEHQKSWLCREFGKEAGEKLLPAMLEFYRLCGIRKPEFMGWNQVELDKKKYTKGWSPVKNTDFSLTEFGGELDRYLESYEAIKEILSEVEPMIPQERKDAFFAQIKYPVFGAAAMSTKMLEAQRARCISPGSCDTTLWTRESQLMAACAKSIKAYQEIRDLTDYYNNELADGKWKYSMCHNPRDLYVFYPPEIPIWLTDKEIEKYASFRRPKSLPLEEVAKDHCIVSNACDYTSASKGVVTIQSLGHSMNAVSVPKGKSITFEFDCLWDGEAILRIAVIPTQPNDKGDIRFSVSIDGEKPRICSIKEPFRSEGWKQNVLRGQAVRETGHQLTKGKHTLSITALDDHVLIDQWMIDFKPDRMFYVFPVQPTY